MMPTKAMHMIVTILILIDGFLQFDVDRFINTLLEVTILILIDGFLQYVLNGNPWGTGFSHNPYFNRWFSAIRIKYNEKKRY